MLATALAFILPPLLRKQQHAGHHVQRDVLNLDVLRDQLRELDKDRAEGLIDSTGYDSARKELERRVAEETHPDKQVAVAQPRKPLAAILLAFLLPGIAIALYLLVGNPLGLDPAKVAAESQQKITPEQVNTILTKIERHLKEAPDDIQGWQLLARSYTALGRYSEAANAYSHLAKLVPNNADLLAVYANTLAMGQGANRSMQGEPEKLINQALDIDPKNVKALALSGEAAFERSDFATAVTQWRKIMQLVPANSDIARSVGASINEALARSGNAAIPPVAGNTSGATDKSSAPSATGAEVSGSVEIDPALRSQVSDTDSVFIFARAVDGPRFPLAVLRKQVKDLPIKFTLDDSMSMMPSAKLSGFNQVIVGARISKTGSATPEAGDLEGLTATVQPGAKNLKIVINSQRK